MLAKKSLKMFLKNDIYFMENQNIIFKYFTWTINYLPDNCLKYLKLNKLDT
jgi:hypothetical protein